MYSDSANAMIESQILTVSLSQKFWFSESEIHATAQKT